MRELSQNKRAIYQRSYRKSRPDVNRLSSKKWSKKIREQAIEALGGKCCQCSYSDNRALQIDHINGGGSKKRGRNNIGWSKMYYEIIGEPNNKKYQLLCANCNWIKKHEDREY